MTDSKKRAAEEEPSGRVTRSAKATKTEDSPKAKSSSTKRGRKKGGLKTSLGATAFKSRALPLHVNITHTPPAIPDEDTVNAAPADPGFIGTTTLLPSTFSTGSYGWKGNKRLTVELENSETGEKEKVHVMLTINATVIGSKNVKEGEEGETEEKHEKEGSEEEEGAGDTVSTAPKEAEEESKPSEE